jgi:hypothetical protein
VNSNIYCGCGRDIVGGGGRDLFCFVFGGGCGNGTASSVNICYFFCGSDSGSVPSSLGFSFIRYDIILRRLFSYFFRFCLLRQETLVTIEVSASFALLILLLLFSSSYSCILYCAISLSSSSSCNCSSLLNHFKSSSVEKSLADTSL